MTRENVSQLQNKMEKREKAEVVTSDFDSVFTRKTNLQESHVPEARRKGWIKKDVLLVEKNQVREYLHRHRFPREVVESTTLGIFKIHLDT